MTTIGFNYHHFGHSVILGDVNNRNIIDYNDLPCKACCLLFTVDSRFFVTTRHVIV